MMGTKGAQGARGARGAQGALTHVDAEGRLRMVDVGDKAVTDREAVARGMIDVLKGGQFVFAYYPDAEWLHRSKWKCAG